MYEKLEPYIPSGLEPYAQPTIEWVWQAVTNPPSLTQIFGTAAVQGAAIVGAMALGAWLQQRNLRSGNRGANEFTLTDTPIHPPKKLENGDVIIPWEIDSQPPDKLSDVLGESIERPVLQAVKRARKWCLKNDVPFLIEGILQDKKLKSQQELEEAKQVLTSFISQDHSIASIEKAAKIIITSIQN